MNSDNSEFCLNSDNSEKLSTATNKYLTPLFFLLDNLSKKAKSLHQILLNYLEKAYSVRKCLIAGPSFVNNVLIRAKCSTFFFDEPLALLKFRTEPYAALPLEYNLFRLTFPNFERDPSSFVFRFGIHVDNKFRWNLSCFQNGKVNIGKVGIFSL